MSLYTQQFGTSVVWIWLVECYIIALWHMWLSTEKWTSMHWSSAIAGRSRHSWSYSSLVPKTMAMTDVPGTKTKETFIAVLLSFVIELLIKFKVTLFSTWKWAINYSSGTQLRTSISTSSSTQGILTQAVARHEAIPFYNEHTVTYTLSVLSTIVGDLNWSNSDIASASSPESMSRIRLNCPCFSSKTSTT